MLKTEVEEQITLGPRGPWPAAARRRVIPRVVALGGGTGLPIVLRGMKDLLFPSGRKWVAAR
ncbi:MAG: hypothetical protein DMF51_14510, partial [Acidobacteria bacterium]